MKSSALFILASLSATLPAFGNLSFTCDANIDAAQAGTCAYLNTVVAGNYTSTFSNVFANIYIQYGTTGLASSTTGFFNSVSYSAYLADLTANAVASGNPVQIAALAALNANDDAYSNDTVSITSALGSALGIANSSLTGTTALGAPCTIGNSGCYNGIITLSNEPDTWYYDNVGGSEAGLYDIYSAVEHETDEVLGTSSCMDTQTADLSDDCDVAFGGTGNPSAVDLFRYNSAGSLALNTSYIGLANAAAGAYFSYDGGATNGANGFVYNVTANGADYADFLASCPAGPLSVQDAFGCPGNEAGQTILNDGGAEINILNAIGYDLSSTAAAPEPATLVLMGASLLALAAVRGRRK
jgi:PEP-CTERM motif